MLRAQLLDVGGDKPGAEPGAATAGRIGKPDSVVLD